MKKHIPMSVYRARQAKRRARILGLLAIGKSQADIARSLGVSRQAINRVANSHLRRSAID
jgi:DNA-binding CsgD family transcriptional regulator